MSKKFNLDLADLLASLGVLAVTFIIASVSIAPGLVNNALIETNAIKSGRYAVTFPGLDSIEKQDESSIITIGNSILQDATDGSCITDSLELDNTMVYNLAISGANPYTEIIQIPRLVEVNPKAVLLDLGPNSLWAFTNLSSMNDYIEFRFNILSISLDKNHLDDWIHLIREEDLQHLNLNTTDKIYSAYSYSMISLENELMKETHELFGLDYYDRKMPNVGSDEWIDYLQTPNFAPPNFQLWNDTELENWFEENMPKRKHYGVFNPHSNGTLNHISLDYTIKTLTDAGIDVFMVSTPHHPLTYGYLDPGQIDGHNDTLQYFEEEYGAIPVNWFWETWEPDMFRDRNHLGDLGREYYCERISDYLNNYYIEE